MDLTIDVVRSYGFPEETNRPDYDDVTVTFKTPNNFFLTALTVCCNEPVKDIALSDLDDWIYITTKEDLDEFLTLTYDEVLAKIAEENEDFDINEYND